MKKGIDISSHNGSINMKKVKDSGIEFIILRIGYGKNNIDQKFKFNYENAIKNELPVGIYLYSYAINTDDAKKEAQLVLDNIKGLKIEYPIFIDMEDADGYKNKHNINNQTCINICETFCNYIENENYYAGIYSNLNWFNNRINSNKLDKFDKWVAQWNSKCSYAGEYGIWQYSSQGSITGIEGNVDLNYSLKDYPTIIKNANLNHLSNIKTLIEYTVQNGDSLSKIAKKYNSTWSSIYELNKKIIGDNPNIINPGQVFKIEIN